jgi:hypothetical protein
VLRDQVIPVIASAVHERLFSAAKARYRFHQRVENLLEVDRRAADDLEHVRRRGLLLQRFALLGHEPGILDGDHRLRREVLEQPDLLVRERLHFLTVNDEIAEKHFILAQRHGEQSAAAAFLDKIAADRVASPVGLVVGNIRNMHNRLAAQQTGMRVVASDRVRTSG